MPSARFRQPGIFNPIRVRNFHQPTSFNHEMLRDHGIENPAMGIDRGRFSRQHPLSERL